MVFLDHQVVIVKSIFSLELFHSRSSVEYPISAVESGSHKMTDILKEPVADIVCYGIGKITSCPTARYQFAFLLLLKELLQVIDLYHGKFKFSCRACSGNLLSLLERAPQHWCNDQV